MKVILRADVEKLGHLGDIVNVKPGYGRNYLLPQQLASLATPANIRVFELERKKLQARMDALRAAAADLASKLEGVVVTIAMRVGENDKLYGSVTPAMIGDALAAMGIEVGSSSSASRRLHPHPGRTQRARPSACRRGSFLHREDRV